MQICNRSEILGLIAAGELSVDTGGPELNFLDDHRLGLHVSQLFRMEGEVDLSSPEIANLTPIVADGACLHPGSFYLGITRELFQLGHAFAASLHTRSRFARLGLELLGSSNFVVPGFGSTGPAQLVFEISVRRLTKGFDPTIPYCFMLMYRLDLPRSTRNVSDYRNRFPLLHVPARREVPTYDGQSLPGCLATG